MDLEKRKEELRRIWFMNRHKTFDIMFDEIINQEQEIIKQERKDAILEFAKNFWKEEPDGNWMYITKEYTNDLLKQYEIEEEIQEVMPNVGT